MTTYTKAEFLALLVAMTADTATQGAYDGERSQEELAARRAG